MPPSTPTPPSPPIAAWVGLDWADKEHRLTVRPMDGSAPKKHTLKHQPHLLDEFFLELHRQYPQGQIAVVLEQSRGPVIYALMKYSFVEIYPINPHAFASFRRSIKVSGAKDDPLDGDLLGEFGQKHSEHLRVFKVEDIPTRKLRFLVEARREFVHDQTALTNRLGSALKGYYPLVLELFDKNLHTPMVREFLRRWPHLQSLKKAKPDILRGFFYNHHSRSEDLIKKRLAAIEVAAPLTEDEAIVDALQLQASCLVRELAVLEKTIRAYDQTIETAFEGHRMAWLFEALPGAGKALAPRLAAAFGTLKSNFPQAQDLLCLSGVAPVRSQSGQMELIFFRRSRPKFLHQTFVEYAQHSIGFSEWAQLFFQDRMQRGKSKFAAFRALAFKWIRILWRCWTDGVAYDELKYLRSLQKRSVKLYESLYSKLPAPMDTTVVNKI